MEYRTQDKLGEITMSPYLDGIHFRSYIGEGIERTDFISEIWKTIVFRADLTHKYRACLGEYKLTLEKIRGEK